jgi:hypothetical protein
MVKLLINKKEVGGSAETSFGGFPVKNEGEEFEWPLCKSCDGAMQYLGKLATDKGLEQIFMCQNDPGLCDEWDANDGGNKVIITSVENLVSVTPPSDFETTRNTEYGATVIEYNCDNYEDAYDKWPEESDLSPRQVLGQMYGKPSWLQGEEVPDCNVCEKPMRFVAQLEQGPDWETEMNFGGGGTAYIFDCSCPQSAKFLFQC